MKQALLIALGLLAASAGRAEVSVRPVVAAGNVEIRVTGVDADAYVILYRGALDPQRVAVAVRMGGPEGVTFVEALRPGVGEFYRAVSVPVSQPMDCDRDGTDDVTELRMGRDPLSAADGSAVRSFLEEAQGASSPGMPGGLSEVVGAGRLILEPGATVMSVPFHNGPRFVGTLSVSACVKTGKACRFEIRGGIGARKRPSGMIPGGLAIRVVWSSMAFRCVPDSGSCGLRSGSFPRGAASGPATRPSSSRRC
jgi:hypothetical protein